MEGVIPDLGNRIAEFRKAVKLSQLELAEKTGISRGFISQLETGRANPSIGFLYILMIEYKLSLNWLLTGLGEMFINDDQFPLNLSNDHLELFKQLSLLKDDQQEHIINSIKEILKAIETS